MSGLGAQTLINQERAFYLSSIPTDVIHGNIACDTIVANAGYISTLFSDNTEISSLKVSTISFQDSDVSGMYVSSIRGNVGFFSTLNLVSGDLSNNYLTFTVDPSGVQVDGAPIRFDNLVFFTSTITLVPVSTIVDTDIFAANGFYSTLSSGSISTSLLKVNQEYVSTLQGNNGSFSSLVVSSLAATDLSGDFAKRWSAYPTLLSSIQFQPQYVLSNVSNRLYFAGQELTDASGGGQDWSIFPATQDVSMNNFSLRAISTLQFQDGATLTSLTGNNLQYNGLPVQYGNASNVSRWANFPAVANVNMNFSTLSNANLFSGSNLALSGSNITNGNTFTNSLGVGGTSLVSLATINSLGQLSCQDIDVGNPGVGLADVNIYGATAVPGDSALYVEGGVQFNGGTIHGFSAGVIPVAGINTGRIDVLQAGFNLLHPLTGAITTGTALGLTAGAALSLAAGSYIEANTANFNLINTTSGDKQTNLTVGNLLAPPSVAATSSLTIQNIAGGGVQIQAGGQGSLEGFSTVKSLFLSSVYLNVSTINGVAWNDISGSITVVSSFNTSKTSTLQVSTLQGFGPFNAAGSTINVDTGLQFIGSSQQAPGIDGRFISSLRTINSGGAGGNLVIQASTLSMTFQGGVNPNGNIRMGPGGAFDTYVQTYGAVSGVSTLRLLTSTIWTPQYLDISGGLHPSDTIFLALSNGINFDDGSLTTFSRLEYRDVANNAMLALVNTPAFTSNDMERLGVSELWITGASDQFFATRLYSQFPYGNFGIDIVDAAGGTVLEGYNLYDTGGTNYQANLYVVSSITGYTGNIPGSQSAVGFNNIVTIPTCSTQNLLVSSINGAKVDGNTFDDRFSTLFTSSFFFSTATSVGSNTNFNYPLFIDYDQAGNTNGGVAIAVQGHNFGTGAVVNRIEMGARGNGDNYIMSVWPGQNLEDLFIDATEVIVRDSDGFSTIINANPHGLVTNGSVSTPSLLVSSINGNNALRTFANVLQLSSMKLYQNNSTICWWDQISNNSFVTASGYDITIQQNGVYKVGGSRQYNNTSGTDIVEYYFMKNNVPIEYTNSKQSIVNNSELIAYSEIVDTFIAGDTIQLGQYTTSGDVYLSTFPGTYVSSPAVIATIYKVD